MLDNVSAPATPVGLATGAVFQSVAAGRVPWCYVALLWFCRLDGKDLCTESVIKHLLGHVWHSVSMQGRVRQMRAMVSAGYWRELPRRSKVTRHIMLVIFMSCGDRGIVVVSLGDNLSEIFASSRGRAPNYVPRACLPAADVSWVRTHVASRGNRGRCRFSSC